MTAREELFDSMAYGSLAPGEAESVNALIDAYAHELAKQIRAHGGEWREWDAAADLIDPYTPDDQH